MSWLILTLLILSCGFSSHPSEAKTATGKRRHPFALVVGTVYCDTCLRGKFSEASHFIAGASVAVECDATNSKPSFYKEVKTNKHGEFKVELRFSAAEHVKKILGCSVKLIRSSHPYCAVAATTTSSLFHLKSKSPRTHIFSAGAFTFKPLTQPKLCKRKSNVQNSNTLNSVESSNIHPTFLSFLYPQTPEFPPADDIGQFAPMPKLPSLPPLPQLPPLPSLPGLPSLPPIIPEPRDSSKGSDDESSNQKTFTLPPNPFHPPVIWNPFLQPPPAIVPSPPSFIIPPLVQATPSPPPPAFSLIPPFPFEPSFDFPGTPPQVLSSLSNKISP
ncbi:Pollen Ole e 1 allergen/extensin [Heracleum sosnowskyi]|uniref:Pollen Ole e 1 allergen/extensin n=1 Tax=Heracleum sosnowskyi TaxID=360622 RepID=A0AAD8IEE2_9APIA|nr:Pollen Ole e 1 allergen/extensin [Heracleum sosnowskyi]